jgi:chromosome segregation ATPase
MLKKAAFYGLGLLLVGGLLFGSRIGPYAQTAFKKIRSSAEQSVPLTFQIDAARDQLKKIEPEIKNMVWQIAKEKAEIKRLEREVEAQTAGLGKKHEELLTLRNHLKSGETVYVATNGKAYTNARVEEDLRHRFSMFQTAEKTKEKSEQILDLRRKSLEQALAKLEQAQVNQRELEIELENLNARQRMVSVAKTASNINIDDSQLARTKSMIDEISAKIDAEEEMLNLAPKYLGEIPVSEGDVSAQGDIAAEIDAYYGGDSHGEEPQAEIADGKLVKNDK